jgi:hypothetical protein
MTYKKISVIYKSGLYLYFIAMMIAYLTKPAWWEFYFPFHFALLLIFVLTSDFNLTITKEMRFKNLIIKYDSSQLVVILPSFLICALLITNFTKYDFVEFTVLLSFMIYGASLIRLSIKTI